MSDITGKRVLPERSTRNKKNSWKEKDDHQQTEAARKIPPSSKKKSTRVPRPLDLDSDDSLFVPLATSTQIVQSESENQLDMLDEDNETCLIPGTPQPKRLTASSRKRKFDSPTPSSSKADNGNACSVSRSQKTKSAPLVVKAKAAVISNIRQSHTVSEEIGNINSKGKNTTTKSSGKTGSKQSQVENNGVISPPVSEKGPMRANQSQDSNFDQGVLSYRSRVNRETPKNKSSSVRRENDSLSTTSFLKRTDHIFGRGR